MGLIKFLRDGTWWVSSESDPRFDTSGHGSVGMGSMPPDANAWVEARAKELGVAVPDDLVFGYMKD